MSPASSPAAEPRTPRSRITSNVWVRPARMWSGIILFAFVTTHLLNHAVGVFGIAAMEAVQEWRWALWKAPPGAIVLYGAALVHIALTTHRLIRRQTWRMPDDEVLQIIFGFSIPFLIVGHIAETRIGGSFYGVDEAYRAVLYRLWPSAAWWQSALLVVAWTHGVIGLHHIVHHRRWYPRWRMSCIVLAVLIPVLALAGFVAAAREARAMAPPAPLGEMQRAGIDEVRMLMDSGLAAFAIGVVGLLAFAYIRRRAAATVTLTYRGYGPVKVPRGTSVLEASRMHHIPHPSACGGRGRCSTCRIHVLAGSGELPDPFGVEGRLLDRIGASANVRLACQIRPTHDISLRILMPVLGEQRVREEDEQQIQEWALEQEATVLCLDLRAFNMLTRSSQPYEIAVLINRFASEMTQAVEHRGGRVDQMHGHGLVAIFDTPTGSASARNALNAAQDMARVIDLLNAEISGALPIPIRAGIGIHSGPVVLTRIGADVASSSLRAFGGTITIAARLEAATKDMLADFVVSEATAKISKFDFSGLKSRDIMVDGSDMAVSAFMIGDQEALAQVLGGTKMLAETKAHTAMAAARG
jgi:adenylate cyclase